MRTLPKTFVVAAVTLAVGLTACGKSDPKPAEAPAADKSAPADKTKAGDKADEKKADEPAKAAKSDEDSKQVVKPAAPVGGAPAVVKADNPATAPATPPVAVGKSAAPFVYVGTPSLSSLLKTVKAVAENAQVPSAMLENPEKAALDGLKMVMQLSDTSWVDTQKPIRMVLADPRKFAENGAAFVLPISDSAKMLASLPASANKDAAANGGHAATMELRGQKLYIDLVDGHAVLSPNSAVFAATKDAITSQLVKWVPTKPLEVRVDLDAVNRDYAEELKAARQMAKELYAQTMKAQGQGALTEMASGNVDMMFDFIAATKTITVRLDAIKDHVLTSLSVEGASGSGIEQFGEAMNGKRSALLGAVAKGSWMALVANIDTRKIEGLRQMQGMAMRSYAQMLKFDDATTKKIESMVEQMWQMSEGDVAMSIGKEGNFPMAIQYVTSVTDAAKIQPLYHQLTQMIVDAAIAAAKDSGVDAPFLKKGQSLTDIIKAVAPMATQAGLKVEASTAAAGAAKVDVLRVEIDWAKFPMAKQDPEGAKIAKSLLGDKFQFAFAYAGKYMAMTFGPTAEKTAVKLALGKFEGGDPVVAASAALNPMVMTMNFGRMVEAFKSVSPGLADKKEAIAELAKTPPLAMTMTNEGKAVVATLDWPISTIMQFANLMR